MSLRGPLLVAIPVAALYAALLAAMASLHRFDISEFVVAGDCFVDAAQLPVPIPVGQNSFGYDGQFFYRLALDPAATEPVHDGIRFDDRFKRVRRIVYPLAAWAVSLGQPRLVPASLLLLNLLSLGVVGGAAWLARRHGLAGWLPWAVAAWPGWLTTLTHDTAELVTVALLLAAIACYLSGRLAAFAVLEATATLTRETAAPVLAGMLAWEAWSAIGPAFATRLLRRVLPCLLALVPFALWRVALGLWLGMDLGAQAEPSDLGWPLRGFLSTIAQSSAGVRVWAGDALENQMWRAFVILTACGIAAFCLFVATRLPALRRRPGFASVAAGWAVLAVVLSLLRANSGPWVEPTAYFRVFSECYVVGCVLLVSAWKPAWSDRLLAVAATAAAVAVGLFNWVICAGELP